MFPLESHAASSPTIPIQHGRSRERGQKKARRASVLNKGAGANNVIGVKSISVVSSSGEAGNDRLLPIPMERTLNDRAAVVHDQEAQGPRGGFCRVHS